MALSWADDTPTVTRLLRCVIVWRGRYLSLPLSLVADERHIDGAVLTTMQPEARIVKRIQQTIAEKGGRAFKIHGSTKGEEAVFQEAGLPDLLVCYKGRFVGLEVKVPGGKPSRLQLHVLDEIRNAGGIAAVVETVEEVLDLLEQFEE